MISDLQPFSAGQVGGHPNTDQSVTPPRAASDESTRALLPRGTFGLTAAVADAPLQPVADVQAYLLARTAQPSFSGEEQLLITLPDDVRDETKALVRACEFVRNLVTPEPGKPRQLRPSVQVACQTALQVYRRWNWNLKTFRAKYDCWEQHGDWIVLVNKAKAPVSWKSLRTASGLPEEFLKLCETRFGAFKRADGKRQALMSIKRQWQTGRNELGEPQPVAGYEADWSKRDTENIPAGWSYSNILLRIKKARAVHQGRPGVAP